MLENTHRRGGTLSAAEVSSISGLNMGDDDESEIDSVKKEACIVM